MRDLGPAVTGFWGLAWGGSLFMGVESWEGPGCCRESMSCSGETSKLL